jgi:hypothetical protein
MINHSSGRDPEREVPEKSGYNFKEDLARDYMAFHL